MSKITFRADDDLVTRLEERQESKSEIMREALRTYLDGSEVTSGESSGVGDVSAKHVDDLIAERVDATLDERLERDPAYTAGSNRELNVNVTIDGVGADAETADASVSGAAEPSVTDVAGPPNDRGGADTTCDDCGETMPEDHVYCPNCGEKRSHRVFCECGDELRSDWSFCPGCGRRTPAADVLDTR